MMEDKKLLLDVHEKPSTLKWIILAFQHVFAMFGATVLVPVLVNQGIHEAGVTGDALSISVTLVSAGLGTLIYLLCTKGKSPVFLGSSLAFISPMIAAYIAGGVGAVMTGLLVVGLIYVLVSIIIRLVGKEWLDKLLPPIVIGPMIMIIGLSLAASAISNIGIDSTSNFEWKNLLVAVVTFLTAAIVMLKGKGILKIIPFLVGIIAGYILSIILGMVDFSTVNSASWIEIPAFKLPFISYKFDFVIALTMAPIAFVSIAEHIGDHTVLSTIVGRNLLKNPGLDKTLLGDGLATAASALIGGPANTTYGENTSVVGMTKVASTYVIGLAAIITIIFGFLGKITAIIRTIPGPVLGGISLLLYGFISINGLKVLINKKVDFDKSRNIIIASAMFIIGLGGAVVNFETASNMIISLSGMSLAALVGIFLNILLPKEKLEGEKNNE